VDEKHTITVLSALAQESRLSTYRLLVKAGPQGLAASKIAEKLGIPASSLSFHLKELMHAGLIHSRHEGRSIIYSANFSTLNALVGFLTENCCSNACTPASAIA